MGKLIFRLVEISVFTALGIGMVNGMMEGWLFEAFISFCLACVLLPIFMVLDIAISEGSKHIKSTSEQLDQPHQPDSESCTPAAPSTKKPSLVYSSRRSSFENFGE